MVNSECYIIGKCDALEEVNMVQILPGQSWMSESCDKRARDFTTRPKLPNERSNRRETSPLHLIEATFV